MADTKFTDLPAAAAGADADYFIGIQSGVVGKQTNSALKTYMMGAPGAIGGTTPAPGAFTTVSATGVITSTLATGTAPLTVASTTNVANLNASTLSGKTHADPGPIGSGTPSTGAFTTLAASSTVSGAGFTTYLASPAAIGGTVPAAGAFTTSTSTSPQTYSSMAAQYTVLSWGVPLIIPSSGSIGNNGALSGITTLGHTYTSCYMFFPAAAIVAGSTAGFYYVVMSSATAGTIKNNTYTSGIPTIPGAPVAFSTTGPGAYVQALTAITMFTGTVPGGLAGPNGTLTFDVQASRQSGTNVNVLALALAGTTIGQDAQASIQWYGLHRTLRNMGTQAINGTISTALLTTPTDAANVNGATSLLAIDTSISMSYTITGTIITAATDWMVLFGGTVTAQYAP